MQHNQTLPASPCLLRLPEVLRRTGLSRTSVWRLAQRGDFPPPVHFGRSAFWPSDAVDTWITKVMQSKGADRG